MLRRVSALGARRAARSATSHSAKSVAVDINARKHVFDSCWLLDNCTCPRCVHSSGQKLERDFGAVARARVVDAREVGGVLEVVFDCHDGEVSMFPLPFLASNAYDEETLVSESRALSSSYHAGAKYLEYASGTLKKDILNAVVHHGVAVVTNVLPRVRVSDIANEIGGVSYGSLYGDIFTVESTPDPINVAYSNSALLPHVDLAYFEAPPGIQLLHAVEVRDVIGGLSTFVDGMHVAELMRSTHPAEFALLSRVPCMFQKDASHASRAKSVKMFYERPHFNVHPTTNDVLSVTWAPPFEGVSRASSHVLADWYAAKGVYAELLAKHAFSFKLDQHEMVIFNNRRMLHGRTRYSYSSPNGMRKLRGCYVSMDDFLNEYRVCVDATNELRVGLPRCR